MVFMERTSMGDPEAEVIFFETDKIIAESVSLMNLAYAKYEKDIMVSNQKILLESGGYDDMITLYEAAEQELQSKSEGLIATICRAIRTFFEMIAEKIGSLFQKRDGKDIEELVAEKKMQNIALEGQYRDSKKLGAVVDGEMAKGDSLLAKLASGIGVPDETIDQWINGGKGLISKLVPVTLTVGGAVGALAYLKSKIYKYNNDVKPKEEKAKKAAIRNKANLGTSDKDINDRNKASNSVTGKIQKILGHIKWLGNEVGSDSVKLVRVVGSKVGLAKPLPKEKTKLQKVADDVKTKVKTKVNETFSDKDEKKPKSSISSISKMSNTDDGIAAAKEQEQKKNTQTKAKKELEKAPSSLGGKANLVKSRGLVDDNPDPEEPVDDSKKKKNKK